MRWLIALLLLPLAAAVPESEAPQIDARILEVGHEPAVPLPGQQWSGFVRIDPASNVTDVHYQICRVGNACFGPPTATRFVDGVYHFETKDYALSVDGEPVPWGINQAGDEPWLIGVRLYLISPEAPNGTKVPEGRDDCLEIPYDQQDAYVACDATHYFTFEMPGQGPQEAPIPWIIPLIALAIVLRSRRT